MEIKKKVEDATTSDGDDSPIEFVESLIALMNEEQAHMMDYAEDVDGLKDEVEEALSGDEDELSDAAEEINEEADDLDATTAEIDGLLSDAEEGDAEKNLEEA